MDQHKLRTLVFERTGVRIDVDDPVFALVALNEAVLEEAVERHVAQIDAATRELLAGAGVARPRPSPAEPPPLPRHGAPIPTRRPVFDLAPAERRVAWLAGAAAVLAAALVLLGQALWLRPAPPAPAPPAPAPELAADQKAALERAARLERIIAKLDARTRAAIQTQLDHP